MKTVFSIDSNSSEALNQKLVEFLSEIQSLLDRSSDILLISDGNGSEINYHVDLPEDTEKYFEQIKNDVRRYLSLFDYMTVATFRMITETAGTGGTAFDNRTVHDQRYYEKDFYNAAFEFGMDQSSRTGFETVLRLGEERRLHGIGSASDLLGRIKDGEERFAGNAQCLRDRDIQAEMIRKGQNDIFWDYLLVRSELFEYHSILPDERRESNMILDKVIRFSRLNRIDRGYYCEAVYRMITDGDMEKARRLTEEGLQAEYDDSDDDRRAVWKLNYYSLILADNSRDAVMEADLICNCAFQIKDLIWNSDRNSGAIAAGEAYYIAGMYLKAEDSVREQYVMISRCLDERGEPLDLAMDLDEQFRVLLLMAEIKKKACAGDGELLDSYRRCFDMIGYICSCIRLRGFYVITEITEEDCDYILNNMRRYGSSGVDQPEGLPAYGSHRRRYTAMYDGQKNE